MFIKNAIKKLKAEGFTISHGEKFGVLYAEIVHAKKQGYENYIYFNVSSGGFGENAIAHNFRVLSLYKLNSEDEHTSGESFKNITKAINYADLMRELCNSIQMRI